MTPEWTVFSANCPSRQSLARIKTMSAGLESVLKLP